MPPLEQTTPSCESPADYIARSRRAQGLPETPDPDCEAIQRIAAVVRRVIERERGAA